MPGTSSYAVLGTGMVGRALAGRLDELGHRVALGTRDPEALLSAGAPAVFAEWAAGHPAIEIVTMAQAAASAPVVLNATNGAGALEALTAAGAANLAGKVLLDVTNPLDFRAGVPPTLFVKDEDSLAERIQRAFPEARVVKALNTLTAELMVHPERLPEPTTVFVSGDDQAAKRTVVELLAEFGHRDVLDLGDLSTARGPEMYLPLWLRTWAALGTADFNIRVVRGD